MLKHVKNLSRRGDLKKIEKVIRIKSGKERDGLGNLSEVYVLRVIFNNSSVFGNPGSAFYLKRGEVA